MIEERITGSKKNICWLRKKLLNDDEIDVLRISDTYPDRERQGQYYFFVRYKRIVLKKQRKRRW